MILTSRVEYDGRRYFSLVDDALISMSYARTLVDAGEFVWYPGAPRVEGITNPLHALSMALPQWVGLDESASALTISLLGLCWVLIGGWVAGSIAGRLGAAAAGQAATTVAVTLMWPLLFWSVFGLEVGSITALALILAAIALRLRSGPGSGALLATLAVVSAMGVWIRMDFLVPAAAVAVWVVALPSGSGERLQRAAVLFGSLVASMIALVGARVLYFGEVTPNTYALKVGGTELSNRLERAWNVSSSVWPLVLTAGIGAIYLWLRADRGGRWDVGLMAMLGSAQLAYAYYTGGDAFVPDRMFTPGSVTAAVLVVTAVGVMVAGHGRAFGAGLLTAVVLAVVMFTSANGYRTWWSTGSALPLLDAIALVGNQRLAEATAPDAVIAVYGAGAATYWGQRSTVDMLGKNDPVIAEGPMRREGIFLPGHDKWNYQRSIIELKPDVVDADLLQPNSTSELLFPPTPAERDDIAANYESLCLNSAPVLVRKDSTKVDRERFGTCASD